MKSVKWAVLLTALFGLVFMGVAVVSPACAMAQEEGAEEGEGNDGGASDEDAKMKAAFDKKDKDGNGELSEEEFVGKATEKKAETAKKKFKKADADENGSLSFEEFKTTKPAGGKKDKKEKDEDKGEDDEK